MYGLQEYRLADGRLALTGHPTRAWNGHCYYNRVSYWIISPDGKVLDRGIMPCGQFRLTFKPTTTGRRRVWTAIEERYV